MCKNPRLNGRSSTLQTKDKFKDASLWILLCILYTLIDLIYLLGFCDSRDEHHFCFSRPIYEFSDTFGVGGRVNRENKNVHSHCGIITLLANNV